MNNFGLTHWQRIVVIVASLACLFNAYRLFEDDEASGSSFLAGVTLLVLSLSRPRQGESWLPSIPMWIRQNWKRIILLLIAAISIWLVILYNIAERQRHEAAQATKEFERTAEERNARIDAEKSKVEARYQECLRKGKAAPWPYYDEMTCRFQRDREIKWLQPTY